MLTVAVLAVCCTTSLPAQSRPRRVIVPVSLLVISLNDLEFNNVLPGIPKSVSVIDPLYAALFEIQGPANASIRVELSLPAFLTSGGGGLLPVTFGAADGFVGCCRDTPPHGVAFDPHNPVITTLGPAGRIYVRLGGTAFPGRPQDAGAYRASIAITVYDLGT